MAKRGAAVVADEEQVVRAMLRVARMRRAPMPLLLCQADDGVVLPVLSNGALAVLWPVTQSWLQSTSSRRAGRVSLQGCGLARTRALHETESEQPGLNSHILFAKLRYVSRSTDVFALVAC